MPRSAIRGISWLRLLAGATAILCGGPPALCGESRAAGDHKVWVTGIYSFSDELGGFKITATGGEGTAANPFVILLEMQSASPVTMVIRAQGPVRYFDPSGSSPYGFTHFRIDILNNSGLAWIEAEFELQEILNTPSVFGDGLSFDQRRTDTDKVSSDRFSHWSRDFEPYDKLVFSGGKVDPLEAASFTFLVTDFTPKRTFYIVFDPRIPFS